MPDEKVKKESEAKSLPVFKSDTKKLRLHLVLSGVSLSILTIITLAVGDKRIFDAIRGFAISHPLFLTIMEGVSDYGLYVPYLIFFGIAIFGLLSKRYVLFRYAIAYFIIQLIASVIITRVLKFAIGRGRPSDYSEKQIARLRSDSFPSGHSADISSSASTLSYFLSSYLLRILSYLCIPVMGLSRIAVGSHYPLDVLAGVFLGLFTGYIICHVFAVKSAQR